MTHRNLSQLLVQGLCQMNASLVMTHCLAAMKHFHGLNPKVLENG